jgi:branched-chain amino acid transport system substrate-binding protein
MKRRVSESLFGCACVLAVLLAANVRLAVPAAAEIRIGVATPSQGARSDAGRDIRRAARLAAENINESGGLLGERVSLVPVDDGCSVAQAEAAARSLVAEEVAIVIGHPCTGAAVAAARIYAANDVLFIASATRHPDLTDARAGPGVFRLDGRDDRQGTRVGHYLVERFKGEPLAIVYDGSRYAQTLVKDVRAVLKENGVTDIVSASVRGGQKDYAKLVDQLAKAKTKAVFFAAFPMEGALLLRQMRDAGLDTVFIGGDAMATSSFAETAGAAADGALALLPHDEARENADRAARVLDGALSGTLLSTYAAIEAWMAAATQAGSTDTADVSDQLSRGRFETVLGPLSFDEKGDARIPSYDIVVWRNGAWRAPR